MGFKKKAYANPAFHEGLLLLIYEHFKAQTRKMIFAHKVVSSEEIESSYLPSDTKNSVGMHLEDEEEVDRGGVYYISLFFGLISLSADIARPSLPRPKQHLE